MKRAMWGTFRDRRSAAAALRAVASAAAAQRAVAAPPRPKAPNYVQNALHKDLLTAVQRQQPGRVLASWARYVDHVAQPDAVDVDATLNALLKSRRWNQWVSPSTGVQEDGQTGSSELEENELQPLLSLPLCIPAANSDTDETSTNTDGDVNTTSGYTWRDFCNISVDASRRIGNLAWALASLHGESRQELKARVRPLFEKLQESDVAVIVAPQVFSQEISQRMLETCGAENLGQLAWAVARMNLGGPGETQFMQDLGDVALKKKAQWSAQDVSQFTWSFATLQGWHPVLNEERMKRKEWSSCRSSQKGAKDAYGGLAKLQIRDQELMKMVGKEVEAKLSDFSHMGLVCTVWGFASLRLATPFLPQALDHIRGNVRRMKPKDSTMLLWSMATLRHDNQRELLYLLLADHVIVPRASQFQAQERDISICLWAFCTARVEHPRVFRALVAQMAQTEMTSFKSQALANATWACAKMRAEAGGPLLDAVSPIGSN
eukprot:s870_g3.t2